MNFPRIRQWLTVGFSVVLMTLLGTAMMTRQAIVDRAEWTEEESEGRAYLNDLMIAITNAGVNHQTYLETGSEDALDQYYEQLGIVDDYLDEFDEEDEAFEEDSSFKEALDDLINAIEVRAQLLEDGIDQYQTGQLDLPAQLDMFQQSSAAQLDLQLALQALLEGDNLERNWEIVDTSVRVINDLWLSSVVVVLGSLALTLLYGWLMLTLRRYEQVTVKLQNETQSLSQNLNAKVADLQTTKATLRTELSRRQEIETTYKEIEQAKELTDLKLNFFSLASHELRTPLSAILVSAQLLDNPNAEWSETKRSRNLRRIQSAAKTMSQLLADILLLTRAEAGKLEFNPQRIELQDFCKRLVQEVKFNTQAQHHISVLHQGAFEYAHLDETLLRAMLMSLLTNAIKYSPQESEIQFIVWGEDGHTRFQVQDQGIGVPAADQQYLFESFHRGQNVNTVSGTGLGLAVVKKCLDLHGGTIGVESQVGVGTTFTVHIPWVDRSTAR